MVAGSGEQTPAGVSSARADGSGAVARSVGRLLEAAASDAVADGRPGSRLAPAEVGGGHWLCGTVGGASCLRCLWDKCKFLFIGLTLTRTPWPDAAPPRERGADVSLLPANCRWTWRGELGWLCINSGSPGSGFYTWPVKSEAELRARHSVCPKGVRRRVLSMRFHRSAFGRHRWGPSPRSPPRTPGWGSWSPLEAPACVRWTRAAPLGPQWSLPAHRGHSRGSPGKAGTLVTLGKQSKRDSVGTGPAGQGKASAWLL